MDSNIIKSDNKEEFYSQKKIINIQMNVFHDLSKSRDIKSPVLTAKKIELIQFNGAIVRKSGGVLTKNQGDGIDFNTNDLDTQTELDELEDSLIM